MNAKSDMHIGANEMLGMISRLLFNYVKGGEHGGGGSHSVTTTVAFAALTASLSSSANPDE
jgi:hypothetical protein